MLLRLDCTRSSFCRGSLALRRECRVVNIAARVRVLARDSNLMSEESVVRATSRSRLPVSGRLEFADFLLAFDRLHLCWGDRIAICQIRAPLLTNANTCSAPWGGPCSM